MTMADSVLQSSSRPPGGFKVVSERTVYEDWITLACRTVEAPDGTQYERVVVHHPGAVSIVPVLEDGDTVLLVRQYRAAVDRYLLEIPAGKRDVVGESPEETAARELIEEVGMAAGCLELLCVFNNSPGFCDEQQHVFLATDLRTEATSSQSIEEEHMTVERISLRDIPQLIASGVISDAKTMLGLLLASRRLGA